MNDFSRGGELGGRIEVEPKVINLERERLRSFLGANMDKIKQLPAKVFRKLEQGLSLSLAGTLFFVAADKGLVSEDPYGILAELEAMRKGLSTETSAPSDLTPEELAAVERMPKGSLSSSGGVSGFRPLGGADYDRLRVDHKFENAITGAENIGNIGGGDKE